MGKSNLKYIFYSIRLDINQVTLMLLLLSASMQFISTIYK